MSLCHIVGRMLSFFSSRRNCDSPTPHPQASVPPPPPRFMGGGAHSLAREGLGESNSDEGTYTVELCVCIYVLCALCYWPSSVNDSLYVKNCPICCQWIVIFVGHEMNLDFILSINQAFMIIDELHRQKIPKIILIPEKCRKTYLWSLQCIARNRSAVNVISA